jgi:hypothetical protein
MPKAKSTCKWVRRPNPRFQRPRKTFGDLIQIAGDLLGLQGKFPLRSRRRRHQQPEDREILSVITEDDFPTL